MKQKVFLFAIFMMALAVPQSVKAYDFYDFSVVAPSGQTLYYSIISGGAQIVCPTGYGQYGWYDGDYFQEPIGSLVIPNNVTYNNITYPVVSIGESAFYGCDSITSITIPSSVLSIGNGAFYDCIRLSSVIISSGLTSIGDYAFYNCTSLSSITIPNSVTFIGQNAFYNCTSLSSITIPNSVTSIGGYAFSNCTSLTSVVFNADSCVTEEYSYPSIFDGCSSLSEFTIGNNVRHIPHRLCYNIIGLTSIIIPDSVVSIGNDAFYGCDSVTTVTIGSSVSQIGIQAFWCENLTTIYMKPETPPFAPNVVFYHNTDSYDVPTMYVPCGSYELYINGDYESGTYWYGLLTDVREPDAGISITLHSDNENMGSAGVILQHEDSVRCDSTAIVIATANDGYHFTHWSNWSTTNPDTLQLVGDSTVIAYFAINTYTLTVEVNDTSLGTITLPNGDNAPYGDTLMVVASPIDHYHVATWYGVSRTSTTKDTAWVEMINNSTVTCNFAIDMHTVSAIPNDASRGTITGGNEYAYGSSCILTAIPFEGYTFGGWSNGVTSNPYAFLVEGDVELTAIFLTANEETYTVTVSSDNPTMGSATVNGNATATVMSGETVTLTATANTGYRFLRWNDNNTESTRTVTVTEDMNFTAYFESTSQGISSSDASDITVYTVDGRIVVEGAEGMVVRVYDIMGREVAAGGTPALPGGVYLVKVGNHPARRVVVIR